MKKIFCLINIVILWCSISQLFAQTPELIFPATHSAGTVVISADDTWLVSASGNTIKIWDNATAHLLKNIELLRIENTSAQLAISPDSKMLSIQYNDSLYLFNLDNFVFQKRIKLADPMNAFVFSPDGKILYCAGHVKEKYDDMLIYKINIADGTALLLQKYKTKTLATHYINHLSVSADGAQVLSYDAILGSRLVDTKNGNTLKSFEKTIFPAFFLPNGNLLAYSGEKEKGLFLEELDVKTYKSLRKTSQIFSDLNEISAQSNVVSYPSIAGKIALEYQTEVKVFDTQAFDIIQTFKFKSPQMSTLNAKDICLSPNGKYYVQGLTMERFDLTTNKLQRKYGQFPVSPDVHFPLMHTDGVWLGDRVLTFQNGGFKLRRFAKPCADCNFLVRLTADGKRGFIISGGGLYEFDPNAKSLLYSGIESVPKQGLIGLRIFDSLGLLSVVHEGGAYIVDLKTMKLRSQVKKPENGPPYILSERGLNYFSDLSPDKSKLLLYGGGSGNEEMLYCYDLVSKRLLWTFTKNFIANIRFSDNGKTVLLSANYDVLALNATTGNIENKVATVYQNADWDWRTNVSPAAKRAVTIMYSAQMNGLGPDLTVFDIQNNKQQTILRGQRQESNVGIVHFLRNERYLVAEEYGGLRIWDLEKNREIAKILMFEDSDDWLVMAPDGRFDASPEMMKKMYFTKGKTIIALESLYEKFYVPNLLSLAWENDLPKKDGVDLHKLNSPPSVKLTYAPSKTYKDLLLEGEIANIPVEKNNVQLTIEASANGDEIEEIRLYHNGKLISNKTRNLLVEDDKSSVENKTFDLTLVAGENRFRAIAINSQRTESKADELILTYTSPKSQQKDVVTMHLIVVGINAYKNPKYTLNYALADATSFQEAMSKNCGTLMGACRQHFITDANATKANIVVELEKIVSEAQPQDVLVWYYAGHGVVAGESKEFYLVPQDVTQLYGNDDALAQKGLSATELRSYSQRIKAQKQLFILDACQSSGALQTVAMRGAAEEKAIAQLARATGTHWLTAAGSDQFAAEFTQLGHGAFTYALLKALSGAADQGAHDGKITVKELDAYLQEQVPELTAKYKGTPQYPSSYGFGNDFPISIFRN